LQDKSCNHCGLTDRRVEPFYEPTIWRIRVLWHIKWRQVGIVCVVRMARRAEKRLRSTSHQDPSRFISKHDPLALVDPSLKCVPGGACQTTRRSCAWPSGTQRDVQQPTNYSNGSCCRTDYNNSTNLVLTRGSVRLSVSSPEASFEFLFSGSLDVKRMGTTCRCCSLTIDQSMFSFVQ
jgi:hypothetical protein